MCSGNKASSDDVDCGTGYKDKTDKATLAGTTEADCCDQKTCSDLTCPSGEKAKSNPVQPTAGNDPTSSNCCEEKTGTCRSYKIAGEAFECPSNMYVVDIATVAPVTEVPAVDCVNDAFDVAGVEGVAGQGPECPDEDDGKKTTASLAIRSTFKGAWYSVIAIFVLMTW